MNKEFLKNFSDIVIHVDGHEIRAHKLVLFSRTEVWGDLSTVDKIELAGFFVSCLEFFKIFVS